MAFLVRLICREMSATCEFAFKCDLIPNSRLRLREKHGAVPFCPGPILVDFLPQYCKTLLHHQNIGERNSVGGIRAFSVRTSASLLSE